MAISDKLQELIDIKQDIKEAIENKDVDLTGVEFDGYAEKIDELPSPKEEQEVTVDGFIFSSGDVVVTPSTGKVMTKVTVVKDNNLVSENIVKDVNIFGVVGTVKTAVELTQAQYDALAPSKTWVLNTNFNNELLVFETSFISNNQFFEGLRYFSVMGQFSLMYGNTTVYQSNSWTNDAYRTVIFEEAPTGDLLTWLEANAVKQTGGSGYDDNTYYLIVEE